MIVNKKKKYFIMPLAAAILATGIATPSITSAKEVFPDVKTSDYFYEAVQSLQDRGIVKGFTDGTFGSSKHVTRGQVATMIAAALGLNTKDVKNPGFKDVTPSNSHYGAIAALAEAGFVSGYGDGTYGPEKAITRNQMAVIISNAFKLEATSENAAPFTDMNSSYKRYISALYENGVTTGTTATTFSGNANITRGQLAQFIIKAENAGVLLTVDQVSDLALKTSNGDLKIDSSLTQILGTKNATALEGAQIKAVVIAGVVTSIKSITLNAAGTAEKPVVFDGAQASINGDVIVNADYVQLKNINIKGQITLSNKVTNLFTAEKVVSNGDLVIEQGKFEPVASLHGMIANTTSGPKVDLKQSTVKGVDTQRNNVQLNSDTKIPFVKVSANVSSIEVNANVDKVTVNVNLKIEIKGQGNIGELSVGQAEEIALSIAGEISKLLVENNESKVEVGVNLSISELVVPKGQEASTVIKNFDSIKEKIEKILNDIGEVVKEPENNTGGNTDSNENENPSQDPITRVLPAADFSGTVANPKVHLGNVKVSITEIDKLENAVIKGSLTLIGNLKESFSISNVKVEGNLDLSSLEDGLVLDFSDIEVSGETIF